MRVSSQQIFKTSVNSIQQHASDAVDWQGKISSGVRYAKASDNPAVAGRSVQIGFDQAKLTMLQNNQNTLASVMAQSDTQLGSMDDVMLQLQELMVQARDGALGSMGLSILAQKADQLAQSLDQMASVSDSTGAKLFLTSETDLDIDGNVVNADRSPMLDISGLAITVEVEPNVYMPVGITRAEVLGDPDPTTGVPAVLKAVDDLRNALHAGRAPTPAEATAINAARDIVLAAHMQSGLIGARIDASRNSLDVKAIDLENTRSVLQDTDIAEASAGLTRAQTLLTAARTIFSNLESTNLFQMMR